MCDGCGVDDVAVAIVAVVGYDVAGCVTISGVAVTVYIVSAIVVVDIADGVVGVGCVVGSVCVIVVVDVGVGCCSGVGVVAVVAPVVVVLVVMLLVVGAIYVGDDGDGVAVSYVAVVVGVVVVV